MSRIISVNKSNSYDTATFKTPNFKEIVPAPCLYDPKKDETPNPILMDEFGQTPDHFYLATKKPQNTPTFFQVKRKLDLKPIDSMDDNARLKNKPKKKVVPERVRGSKTVDKPRYDTSLGQLTKKFLKLLYSATDGIVNLNTACTLLSVPKRRLYDITNVLEGAGLIQKKSRNNIQYMGRGSSPNKIKYELEKEINLLEAKENRLDELIYHIKSQMNSVLEEDAKYHYITSQDIFHLEDFSQKMLIGLKTSPSVEVVESTEKTLFVRSSTTELEAYLLFEDFPFTNILHPQAALKEQSLSYEIKIANCTLDGNKKKLDAPEETACANAHTDEKQIDSVSKSTDDVYSPMCSGAFWSQGDTLIKNAFITEEDDIAPIGKHFLLQTEDQDLDFSFLEASENYSFSLDDGEGLTDLFDCNFSCP